MSAIAITAGPPAAICFPTLTEKQWRVVGFMRWHLAEFDRLPTLDLMREHFDWASQTAAADHIANLIRKGVLEKASGRVRFARLPATVDGLIDEALEFEIKAAGLRLEAAHLASETGCYFAGAGEATHYAQLQTKLIAARSPAQVKRMELERGLTAEALRG